MAQIQIMSGVERRRRWSDEEKRTIVAAAFAPGAVVAEVARRADVCSSQIYRWRREMGPPVGFAEVIVAGGGGQGGDEHRSHSALPAVETARSNATAAAVIEVAIGGNVHVRIAASSPPALAAAVVKVLSDR
jgi:transposase